jgi:Spy/CpxP family protein refolding chaperone
MPKHSLLALTLAGLIYAAPAVAQNTAPNATPDQQSPSGDQHHGQRGMMMDPAKRTEHLTKKLNLTADQQAKVLEVFKTEQSQMEALHNDSSLSRPDRRSKMMGIHKSSDDQVRTVLDSTQQKKWDEMQANRDQRMQGHHHGGQPQPDSDDQ